MSQIKEIAVVGAGQMGSGIAQVCASSGFQVRMQDISQESLDRAQGVIEKSLDRLVKKEKISAEQKQSCLSNITTSTKVEDLASCDLLIEAATENVDLKLSLFSRFDQLIKKDAILASNTSSISITKIAGVTQRPEKVIGMHFMNPVPIMKLVEVINGLRTSEETTQTVLELSKAIGKTTVTAKDFPGFLVNRILCPMINEAVFALESGIASPKDIDAAMKLGTNQPMGPLELADFVGLDTVLAIMEVLHEGLGEDKYRPAPLLRQYVEAGLYGRKSGQGFYEYTGGNS
ncbi:MAG: 3-hydroxybutyryl-CoA dehydrogenase [Bdellovibrionales bacterium]|nr:3-hydroxybutyryl-CoA dehydrogenase [Bdellovibrionales bacterium]